MLHDVVAAIVLVAHWVQDHAYIPAVSGFVAFCFVIGGGVSPSRITTVTQAATLYRGSNSMRRGAATVLMIVGLVWAGSLFATEGELVARNIVHPPRVVNGTALAQNETVARPSSEAPPSSDPLLVALGVSTSPIPGDNGQLLFSQGVRFIVLGALCLFATLAFARARLIRFSMIYAMMVMLEQVQVLSWGPVYDEKAYSIVAMGSVVAAPLLMVVVWAMSDHLEWLVHHLLFGMNNDDIPGWLPHTTSSFDRCTQCAKQQFSSSTSGRIPGMAFASAGASAGSGFVHPGVGAGKRPSTVGASRPSTIGASRPFNVGPQSASGIGTRTAAPAQSVSKGSIVESWIVTAFSCLPKASRGKLMDAIVKALGDEKHADVLSAMTQALTAPGSTDATWVRRLYANTPMDRRGELSRDLKRILHPDQGGSDALFVAIGDAERRFSKDGGANV